MGLQKRDVKPSIPFSRLRNFFARRGVQQAAVGIIMFITVYAFAASSIAPQKYNLSVGDISPVDITSPKDIIDTNATEKLIQKKMDEVGDVYTTENSVQQDALKSVDAFFQKVNEVKSVQGADKNTKISKLKSESSINLADDDYKAAIDASDDDLAALQQQVKTNLASIFEKKIGNDENDIKSKKQDFSYMINNLKLSRELKDLGTNIGFTLIKPNMVFDSAATNEKREAAKNEVTPVRIKKNQIIVQKNTAVTADQLSILESLGLLEKQNKIDMLLYLGTGIIIALLECLIIIYMARFCPDVLESVNKLVLMSIIVVIELLFAKFISTYSVSGFLIPVAFASMLVSILLKARLAIVLNIFISGIVALMTGYSIETLIVALIGGTAGAILVSKMHQRNDMLITGLAISLVDALSIFGLGLINNTDILSVLMQSLMGILNGILSSVFAIGLLPFCETTFDIVTPTKLLELSNPNQPLLKRLLFEAPGTYHHSILVGNLAEAASQAIGANSLLARVGSYYHDIGKLKRPYFFKENQVTNDNPHDRIAPSLSALIITNHIKDGAELAKKYKLPGVIEDIIRQHHGTTLVKYFYVKAVNDGDSHDEITENQYRYEGPKPQTKETAIIMLADSVEAAVRSIPSPVKPRIEETVKKITNDKLADGQFDECDITIKDINIIESAFLKVLNGIYHDRIEYPEINDKSVGDEKN